MQEKLLFILNLTIMFLSLFLWFFFILIAGVITALCEGSSRTGVLLLGAIVLIIFCAILPFLYEDFPWHPANETLDVILWMVYTLVSIVLLFVVELSFENWLEKRRERKIKEREEKSMLDDEKASLSKETSDLC